MTKYLFVIFPAILCFSCNQQTKIKEKAAVAYEFTSGLTEDTACLLSQLAYCPVIEDSLSHYMPGWTLLWDATELNGNHAFVAGNGRDYALAIRGSLMNFTWSAFQNWIYQDLHVTTQRKWPYTKDSSKAWVSQGAYTGLENLNNTKDKKSGKPLISLLDSLLKTGAPLLITGHSLGGNLATVYGSYLWQECRARNIPSADINIITFGAPAAGDAGFANDFDNKFPHSIRVENRFDIVPKFPTIAGMNSLSELFSDSLSADKTEVGYKNMQVSLSRVFSLLSGSLELLDLLNVITPYRQTNGQGKQIKIALSAKNQGTDVVNWMNEAGFQHSITQYAKYEKVPLIHCD